MTEPQNPEATPAEQTTPAEEPKGESYWQSKHDKLNTSFQELQSQVAELTSQLEARPPTEPQAPETTPESTPDIDWNNPESLLGEDGKWSAPVLQKFETAGIPSDIASRFLSDVNFAQTVIRQNAESAVKETFQSRENFDSALSYLKDKDASMHAAVHSMLNDPQQYKAGIQLLAINTEDIPSDRLKAPPEKPAEPGKLPESTGGGAGDAIVPLKPGSAECNTLMSDTKYGTDLEFTKQVDERIKAFVKNPS